MLVRKLLVAAFLASSTVGVAVAADLPARYPPPGAYMAPVPVFNWTGFYVGANVGGAFDNHGGALRPNFTTSTPIGGSQDSSGFMGGGQIGYNVQYNQFVVGLEADADYLGLGNSGAYSTTTSVGTNAGTLTATRDSGDGFLGTVRGRVGYAFLPRMMAYATGGLAFGQVGSDYTGATFTSNTGGVTNYVNNNATNDVRIGYAIGAGLEYAFTNNLSAKLEYLYADLGRRDYTLTDASGSGNTLSAHSNGDMQIARVGLNYKF